MTSLCGLYVLFVSFFAAVYGARLSCCPYAEEEEWSYCLTANNGPQFWGQVSKDCDGNEQSPINIKDAEKSNLDKLFLINYDNPISKGIIENNGHTIQVTPSDGVNRTISVYGVEYNLLQLHFHWGDKKYRGSEHAIRSHRYAMEMHLVHTNGNDTAVVGIFFKESKNDNDELQKIIAQFPGVKYKYDEVELKSNLNLRRLVPANPISYYRYQGSFTTPPCTQGVVWSVAPHPVPVGTDQVRDQMVKFRNELYSVREENAVEACKLYNNYRPLQERNGREIYLSQLTY